MPKKFRILVRPKKAKKKASDVNPCYMHKAFMALGTAWFWHA